MKRIVSFGGGTNSVAMLVNMVKHQLIPDEILFADTGGEKPNTYEYIRYFNKWLESKNFPTIKTVKYKTKRDQELSLEQDCLDRKTLPSVAFGFKTCSQRWKINPVERYLKFYYPGEKIQIWVGFDAGEERRIKANPVENFENYFPLIEWGWTRERCIERIKEVGLDLPGKSSCFFCPNMKISEILALPIELQERAMAMEKNATQVAEMKGLGRNRSWTSIIMADRAQLKIEDDLEDWHQPNCDCIT